MGRDRETVHEETKADEFSCRYCRRQVPNGRMFEHESVCPEREPHQSRTVPKQAAFMGAITHPGKAMKAAPDNNWRAKH